jgi:hypothetical protein
MFIPMTDLPDTAVGFTAQGTIHAEDYKDTLIPAIGELIAQKGRARVLLVLGPEWEGYSAGAMFDDVKLGLEHLRAWERFALVSDADWIHHVAKIFGWIVPGDVRSFPYSQLNEAKTWITS